MGRSHDLNTFLASSAFHLAVNLRVLIADDEQLCRERLRRLLDHEPGIEIVAECANGFEALRAIRSENLDLAFLDVRMPELDAFGVLESLEDARLPVIILVTAYDGFALRAFDIDAVDYLLKPFDEERLQIALRRARQRLQWLSPVSLESFGSTIALADEPVPRPTELVTVKSGRRILLIRTAEIDWISAADNYVELHVGNNSHLLRTTIHELANRLQQNRFARISRSVVVNVNRIKEFRSKSHGDYLVILQSGVSLAGSRNYRNCLESLLGRT